MNVDATVQAVIDAPTEDMAELLKIAGLDPAKHLRYASWEGADFGEADVTGWDFTGARLDGANLSKVHNIGNAFFNRNCNPDTTTEFIGTILPDGVTVDQLMQQS